MLSKYSKKLSVIFMVVSMSLVAGCSSIVDSVNPVESAQIFDLIPIQDAALKGRRVGFNLSISEPRAAAILDSDKILVKPTPLEVQFYGDIVWADRIPKLIHRRIVQAFEDSNRLRSVAPRSDGFDAQYDLLVEIRDFQLEPSVRENTVLANPLRVKVTFYAKFVSDRAARVVRSVKITKYVEVEVEDSATIAAAFNKAFADATIDLVKWTLR